MNEYPVLLIKPRDSVALRVFNLSLGIRIGAAFSKASLVLVRKPAALLDIVLGRALRMVATVERIVVVVGLRNYTGLVRGACGIGDMVMLGMALLGVRTMVEMFVVVFSRDIERRIIVAHHTRHWRAVMLTRKVGHDSEEPHEGNYLGGAEEHEELEWCHRAHGQSYILPV
jgi:hypothetical protein